jgi:hypothetical protein
MLWIFENDYISSQYILITATGKVVIKLELENSVDLWVMYKMGKFFNVYVQYIYMEDFILLIFYLYDCN